MSAKRKAAQAAAVAAEDEMEGPAPKRRKLPVCIMLLLSSPRIDVIVVVPGEVL